MQIQQRGPKIGRQRAYPGRQHQIDIDSAAESSEQRQTKCRFRETTISDKYGFGGKEIQTTVDEEQIQAHRCNKPHTDSDKTRKNQMQNHM